MVHMYTFTMAVIAGVVSVLHYIPSAGAAAVSVTNCVQRDPNTRDILKTLQCADGCCGNEMTYQVCCEVLHPPNRIYTQYDLWRGWNPVTIFLLIIGLIASCAFGVALIFCIVRMSRKDKRTCSWI